MNINANDNDNISGTLVLPLWQGTTELSEEMAAGVHRVLKNQIDMVLSIYTSRLVGSRSSCSS